MPPADHDTPGSLRVGFRRQAADAGEALAYALADVQHRLSEDDRPIACWSWTDDADVTAGFVTVAAWAGVGVWWAAADLPLSARMVIGSGARVDGDES